MSNVTSPTTIFAVDDLNGVFRVGVNKSLAEVANEDSRESTGFSRAAGVSAISSSSMTDRELSTFSETDDEEDLIQVHSHLINRAPISIFRSVPVDDEGYGLQSSVEHHSFEQNSKRGTKRSYHFLLQPNLLSENNDEESSTNDLFESNLRRANPVRSNDYHDDDESLSSSESVISLSSFKRICRDHSSSLSKLDTCQSDKFFARNETADKSRTALPEKSTATTAIFELNCMQNEKNTQSECLITRIPADD